MGPGKSLARYIFWAVYLFVAAMSAGCAGTDNYRPVQPLMETRCSSGSSNPPDHLAVAEDEREVANP